uniref:BTB domain-containing protein n=1 Tax=Timema shepardi TaxID=629360 RepID=A0A7R9B0H2_TIMSH|nr:unnamed protein product [Timema shepardi]
MDIIGSVKQVKVDNWGVFFLQRLQTFHSKGDFCDLILQFHSNECVKVHRLVLSACTEYFQMLERAGNLEGDTLLMPADMKSQVVLPIINFMYTGRLEYRIELQDRLYSTAKQMNMMVLTKLLDAQAAAQTATPRAAAQTAPPRAAMNKSLSQIHHVAVPVKKYGQPKVVDPNLPETLPGRKLPIWKRRSVPTSKPSGSDYFSSPYTNEFDMSSRSSDEPRPTRFEWPDADTSVLAPMTFTSAFDNLSYETPPIIKASKTDIRSSTTPINMSYPTTSKASTFEDIKRNVVTKRPASMMLANDNNAKKAKMMDLQAPQTSTQEEEPHASPIVASSKKVRFSFDTSSAEEKENAANKVKLVSKEVTQQPVVSRPQSTAMNTLSNSGNVSNHAKIISEVLKKYPNLVKKNKNIKLKIMHRGGLPTSSVPSDGDPKTQKPKVSYVMLKSDMAENAKNLSEELVDDEDEAHSLDIMENINANETITELPLINTIKGGNMSLPPGVTLLAEAPAVPSSEAEALNNVASGIATSLGLAESSSGDQTVIVLDDSQEYYLHTTEVTDDNINDIQECVVDNLGNHVRENQEFIVPEIMAGEEQQYSGLTAYTTPDGQTVVVSQAGVVTTCPTVMAPPINTSSGEVTMILSDHNYVEEGSFRAGSVPEGMMIYITQPATGELGVLQQQIPVTLSDVAENSSVLIAQPKANQVVVMSSDDKPQNELCEDVAVTKTDLVREVVSQEMVVNVQAMKNCIQEKILVEGQSDKRREDFEHGNLSMSNMPSLDEDVLIQPSESPDQSLNNDMREIEEDGNCREMLEEAEEGPSGVGAQVSTPVICRRPFVEMEELVRDWDDFDEEGEVLPETEGEKNEDSEGAQVLRTMKTEISDTVPRLVKHEQEET